MYGEEVLLVCSIDLMKILIVDSVKCLFSVFKSFFQSGIRLIQIIRLAVEGHEVPESPEEPLLVG